MIDSAGNEGAEAKGGVRTDTCDAGRRRLTLGLGAFALAPLVACSNPAPWPLVVGLNPWVGYDALVLAREQGLYQGKSLKVVELPSLEESVRQFRNGLTHVAAVTLGEALRMADRGVPLSIVAVCAESSGADVVMAAPGIDDIAGLKGKKVVLEDSTSGRLILHRMLQAGGLPDDAVELVFQPAVKHVQVLGSHLASAAVSYQPVARALQDVGYRPLFSSEQMPGEIVDVLVARSDVVRDRQNQLRDLLATWSSATSRLLADPQTSAEQLAPGSGLTVEEYLDVFRGLRLFQPEQSLRQLDSLPPQLAQNAERLSSTMVALGMLADTPDWGALIDPEPLAGGLAQWRAGA